MHKKLLKWEYIICIQFFSVYSERCFQMKKIKGFTLAEALLTMTILGVVAAFLIPTIVTDVREHANRARRQAMAVDISNALSHMVMLENRISWNREVRNNSNGSQYIRFENRTNEPTGEFIVYHLANYMKFAKICSPGDVEILLYDQMPKPASAKQPVLADNSKSTLLKYKDVISNISLKHSLSANSLMVPDYDEILEKISKSYQDCGWLKGEAYRDYDLVNTFSVMDLAQASYIASIKNNPNVAAAAMHASIAPWSLKTQNGISMILSYSPYCADSASEYVKNQDNEFMIYSPACINIVYDVNGATPPNIIGNDVGFATVFFGKKPKVTVPVFAGNYDFEKNYTLEEAEQFCLNNSASGNEGIPTAEEMFSMIINSRLLPASISEGQAKSIVYSHSPSKWTEIYMKTLGVKNTDSMNQSGGVICTYKQ